MVTLPIILLLLGAAVVSVILFRRAGLPPILGYLVAGALIGPHVLGFVEGGADAQHLAEFGVVFLMFSIGLEFSLARLSSMRRIVFGLGGLQVALTLAAVTATEQQEPKSTGDAMRAILDGSLPLQSDDALAMAMAKVLILVRDNWARLPAELGSGKAAIGWENTPKVQAAYIAALTQNGKLNYRGKTANELNQTLSAELKAGRWPVLP